MMSKPERETKKKRIQDIEVTISRQQLIYKLHYICAYQALLASFITFEKRGICYAYNDHYRVQDF